MVDVGDKVFYVPGEEFAFDVGPDGFAWAFGKRVPGKEEVVELTDSQVWEMREGFSRNPELRKALVPIAPKGPWPAVVTVVHGDGRLSLDVEHPLSGVTLGMTGVAHGPDGEAGKWYSGDDSSGTDAEE